MQISTPCMLVAETNAIDNLYTTVLTLFMVTLKSFSSGSDQTMGNTCGFGVINKSALTEINIGLSMFATHKFENGVRNGEIFFRCPGAVYYTVYAFTRRPHRDNDIMPGQVSVAENVLYCEMKGCYGGSNGTWLIRENGPTADDEGLIHPNALTMRIATSLEAVKHLLITLMVFTTEGQG